MTENNNNNANLEETVAIVAKQLGIHDYVTTFDAGSIKGDNYLGVITAIDVRGKSIDGKTKDLQLIAKSALTNEMVRKEAMVNLVYGREIFIYNEVFKEYETLQKDLNLDDSLWFKSYPKCYYTSTEPVKEILILGNLKTIGYKLWDRKKPMNEEHVSYVLKEYGKLHATSLALKQHRPEIYANLSGKMRNFLMDNAGNMEGTFTTMFQNAINYYDPDTEQEAINYLQNVLKQIPDFYTNPDKMLEDHIVFIHGDCWTNNMLFRYEDLDNPNKPTAMVFLDFQMSRVGSPIEDVAYYYYCCTSKEIFNRLDVYQRVYYDSLAKHLRLLDCDPDVLFSYDTFLRHWRTHAKIGLVCSLMLIRIMLSDQSEAPDMAKTIADGKQVWDAFNYESSQEEECKRRVKDVIAHMMAHGF